MVPDEGTRCWEVQGLAPAINNRINRLTTAVPHCGHILTATAAGGAAISTALAASERDAQKCYTLCNPVTHSVTYVSNRELRSPPQNYSGPKRPISIVCTPIPTDLAAWNRNLTVGSRAVNTLGHHDRCEVKGLRLWAPWFGWVCARVRVTSAGACMCRVAQLSLEREKRVIS